MLNIKDINIGDTIEWIDGAGYIQREEVTAADDGAKSILLSGQFYSVKHLINVNDTVRVIKPDYRCHICGQIGGH